MSEIIEGEAEVISEETPLKSIEQLKIEIATNCMTHYNNLINAMKAIPVENNDSQLSYMYHSFQATMLSLREFIFSLSEKKPEEDTAP